MIEEGARSANSNDAEGFSESMFVAEDSVTLLDTHTEGMDTVKLIRMYYPNGSKNYDAWLKNGQAHGECKFYYPSGKLRYVLVYEEGRTQDITASYDRKGEKNDGGTLKSGNGDLLVYHPYSGKLQYRMQYRHGLRHGAYTAYFLQGEKGSEARFVNDSLSGSFIRYFRSGRIYVKGFWERQSQSGFADTYYATGNIRMHEDFRNGAVYAAKQYDLNGTITEEKKRVNGKLATTKYFYGGEGKLLSKEQMLGDQRHGLSEYFYENGTRKSHEYHRHDTIQCDTIWNSNGKISAISYYQNGRKHGVYQEYYPTGVLRVEQMYANGVEEGMYRSYFASGKLYNEGQFKNGKLSGDLEFYTKNGTHSHTKHYP